MPRTFLLRREEPLSDKGDSCNHEHERQSSLPKSVSEAGPSSMKPESPRILGQQKSRANNSVPNASVEMKPLQERNTLVNNRNLAKATSGSGDSRQSSLEILATAAAQCAVKDSSSSSENRMKPSENTDIENVVPGNSQQKLPSFATLAFNMVRNLHGKTLTQNVRTEKRSSNEQQSEIRATSLQTNLAPNRTKRSPKKSPKKSFSQGKENMQASKHEELPPRFTSNSTHSVKHNIHASDQRLGVLKPKSANDKNIGENVLCKNSKSSPAKETKNPVKPKIWNPMFHEYTPKKQQPITPVEIKPEPGFGNISENPSSSLPQKVNVTPVNQQRNLIKHTVESMIQKGDASSGSPKIDVAEDVTLKRLQPKHDEEPSAKKIKLENNGTTLLKPMIHGSTEMKTPSKFSEIKQEFPMYNISMAQTPVSPYFPRGFEPSPKPYANVPLRPLLPTLQHCSFSPFSPSFGRSDNILTPDYYKSPLQFSRKLSPQTNLDTPVKPTMTSVPLLTSSSMMSSQQSPGTQTSESMGPRVLAPKFTESENQQPSKESPSMVEVVNGGFGIKNPSYRPPKPSDITNIQQDSETGKGKYICKICSKEFGLQRLLNRHLKCHSDVKRYLCTFCGKGFNDTFDLKRHTRIHTGVKPYACSECDRSFTQRCSLESHCRKVHNMDITYAYKQRRNKIYVCEECGHSTADASQHFVHLRENHPNNPALTKCHDRRQFKFCGENQQNVHLPRT
ncbi:uncharacterized protein LOC111124530 isoform X1 [Crassostrea virginica]